MRRTLLAVLLAAWILTPAVIPIGSAVSPLPGAAMTGPGGEPRPTGGMPLPLLANVSLPPPRTSSAEDWYGEGFALTGRERYAEAIVAYEKALAANRSHLNAWYYLADALHRLGRPREALLALENATAIDPDFVEAYFAEALIYRELGLPQEEKEALREGLEAADRREAEEGARGTPEAPGSIPVGIPAGSPLFATGIAAAWMVLRQRNGGS
jgi:tetratricopeptide (TPR) repeat protein